MGRNSRGSIRRRGFLLVVGICLWIPLAAGASFERLVVLYAPASDLVKLLGGAKLVVGVTRTDHNFQKAVKVGSHLRPNIELIKALEPDLIITGSERAFPASLQKRFQARFYRFDPLSLNGVLRSVESLGELLDAQGAAGKIVARQREKLRHIRKLRSLPTVVYEISERPLRVAGLSSIMTSIIETAGGRNAISTKKKHVVVSAETIIDLDPDLYIYQTGPMNKNPEYPLDRPYFKLLRSRIVPVDQYRFSRPGINVFEATAELNRIFLQEEADR